MPKDQWKPSRTKQAVQRGLRGEHFEHQRLERIGTHLIQSAKKKRPKRSLRAAR